MEGKLGMLFTYYEYGMEHSKVIFNSKCILSKGTKVRLENWKAINESDAAKSYKLPIFKLWKFSIENDFKVDSKNEKFTYERGLCFSKVDNCLNGIKGVSTWVCDNFCEAVDMVTKDDEIIGFSLTNSLGFYCLIRDGYEEYTPLAFWNDTKMSSAIHQSIHIGAFMIPMRDGIRLNAKVWLPSSREKNYPVILVRTPYGINSSKNQWMYFTSRGYGLVIQDVRGREDSGGKWEFFINEKDDGNDTLDWIAQQEWCDGNIGMIGESYKAYVQWAAASSGNRNLKAMVSIVTGGSPFGDIPRRGGAMITGMLPWIFKVHGRKTNVDALIRNDWRELIKHRPICEIPQKALGEKISFWNDWMKHPNYDNYWARMDFSKYTNKFKVNALIVTGWYDDDKNGSFEVWDMCKDKDTCNLKMIIGPWPHQTNTFRTIHKINVGSNGIRYDLYAIYLKWFDRYLKNINNGIDETSKVEYFISGGNKWRTSDTWPPTNTTVINYYLTSSSGANSSCGDGYISNEQCFTSESDLFIYDPTDPFPHLIDLTENELNVPENYRDVELRKDVLIYTSEPINEELIIAGEIEAEIYAKTSGKDTDWIVRITDVDDKGNSIRITEGFIRARYRYSYSKPTLLRKGQIEKYNIKLGSVAYMFKAGHRIRIQITSGAENLIFPNTGTGAISEFDKEYVVSCQTIYHSKNLPSHVKIPVLV